MSKYLLDTNSLSDAVRQPRGRINKRIAQVGAGAVVTSIIVAAEARFGAARSGSARLATQLEIVLAHMIVLPFEAPADLRYAEIRANLQARGLAIGANDLLIAAHAVALGCVLVTANEREFRRVEGLVVENWLA